MTSAQTMQPVVHRAVTTPLMHVFTLLILVLSGGCGRNLTRPIGLAAPYDESRLWGVAPPANESGVSIVDTARIADAFMAEAQHVDGINAIPVNRVIAAMRELDMPRVATPGDARTLMNVLDLDGLIVGTVTAYDPYEPMSLGLAVQLYTRPMSGQWNGLDTRELSSAPRGDAVPGELGGPFPAAQAAGVFDAANHQTLAWLDAYATGRHMPDSAYGRDIYLVSMDLYTRFVCYRLIRELLQQERATLVTVAEQPR